MIEIAFTIHRPPSVTPDYMASWTDEAADALPPPPPEDLLALRELIQGIAETVTPGPRCLELPVGEVELPGQETADRLVATLPPDTVVLADAAYRWADGTLTSPWTINRLVPFAGFGATLEIEVEGCCERRPPQVLESEGWNLDGTKLDRTPRTEQVPGLAFGAPVVWWAQAGPALSPAWNLRESLTVVTHPNRPTLQVRFRADAVAGPMLDSLKEIVATMCVTHPEGTP